MPIVILWWRYSCDGSWRSGEVTCWNSGLLFTDVFFCWWLLQYLYPNYHSWRYLMGSLLVMMEAVFMGGGWCVLLENYSVDFGDAWWWCAFDVIRPLMFWYYNVILLQLLPDIRYTGIRYYCWMMLIWLSDEEGIVDTVKLLICYMGIGREYDAMEGTFEFYHRWWNSVLRKGLWWWENTGVSVQEGVPACTSFWWCIRWY